MIAPPKTGRARGWTGCLGGCVGPSGVRGCFRGLHVAWKVVATPLEGLLSARPDLGVRSGLFVSLEVNILVTESPGRTRCFVILANGNT